jgi:ribosomal protein S28E/S33
LGCANAAVIIVISICPGCKSGECVMKAVAIPNLPVIRLDHVAQHDSHPIANFLPAMEEKQLAELTESIRRKGLVNDIIQFEGKILDGRALSRVRSRFLAPPTSLCLPRSSEVAPSTAPISMTIGNRA